jgi:hypothetical protein
MLSKFLNDKNCENCETHLNSSDTLVLSFLKKKINFIAPEVSRDSFFFNINIFILLNGRSNLNEFTQGHRVIESSPKKIYIRV